MDNKEARRLLTKYYDGETDSVDEARLMDYLSRDDIPADMTADRKLFALLYGIDRAKEPKDIERRMRRQTETWDMIEQATARRERRLSLRWMSGIAASLLVLTMLGVLVKPGDTYQTAANETGTEQRQYTQEEIERARAVTELALVKFSKSMNKGLDALGRHDD